MKIKFLLDENLSPRLKIAVLRLNSDIDILRVGDDNAPKLGTLDPDVLSYLGLSQRLLVTDNRTSMPEHLKDYWRTHQKMWGLLWVRPATTMGTLAEELTLIWETSEAEEWINVIDWIPF
jgi:hypothetical protein